MGELSCESKAKNFMNDSPVILLIGASGFLGSRLFDELSKKYQVTGTYFSRLVNDLVFLDTSNRKQVKSLLKAIQPDVLIDCGGMTRPDACEQHKGRAYQINVEGVANLMDFCNCKTLYFSTDYVFDGSRGEYTENDEPCPINYYGWTKREAEKIVLSARSDNVVIRVSGLYGVSARNNEFLALLNQPVVYKATDCLSSNLLIDDIVQHIPFFWSGSGVYHLTDGQALSRYEFTVKVVRILKLSTDVVGKPASEIYRIAQRPRNSSLISVRHKLPIHNVEAGLQVLSHQLTPNQRAKQYSASLFIIQNLEEGREK